MALLQFSGACVGLAASGASLEDGWNRSLSSAAHFRGIANEGQKFVSLVCKRENENFKRENDRQNLVQAVYEVRQQVENEGSGNSESRSRQFLGAGRGSWNERSAGRGRGRGRGGGGGDRGRGRRGRGGGTENFSRERRTDTHEYPRRSRFAGADDDEENSHRPSSSNGGDFEFRRENGDRGNGYGAARGQRWESRTSDGGNGRGNYRGQASEREESYARGSYGRGRARPENGAGRFSSRGSDDTRRNDGRDTRDRGTNGRGRGYATGRSHFRGEASSQDDNFRVNLPERSDSRERNAGGGKFALKNDRGESKVPWTGLEEKHRNAGKAKGSLPTYQTVTPRQSASQFNSDRSVFKAPWEQGSEAEPSPRSFGERDFTLKNPLIERLQRLPPTVIDNFEEDVDEADDDESQTTSFVPGGEKSAMARIVEKLSRIPSSQKLYESRNKGGRSSDASSIFLPKTAEPLFPMVQKGWSTPDHPVPTPAQVPRKNRPDTRFPWEREEEEMLKMSESPAEKQKRVKAPSLAELTIPEEELKRLRSLGILARHRIKIGKAGVTTGIVEAVHNEWRDNEVVRVKAEGPPAMNMKKTHQELEERTGGLVVWRAGGACLLYRGKDYVPPQLRGLLGAESAEENEVTEKSDGEKENGDAADDTDTDEEGEEKSRESVVVVPKVPKSVYDPDMERELEEILTALGPRYVDWSGGNPVPVDADQLLDTDVQFTKPYRLLPYGVKSSLSNNEMTELRRLARPIPPHFVLGRNRHLDGLAAAIVKLWEKSEIAKIAVKRGVQNTNHERMGEELKRLTGGVLLARDKYFIVLYRGKDFLPPSVAAALSERQAMTQALQEEEEKVRLLAKTTTLPQISEGDITVAGTLTETLEAKANWEVRKNSEEERISRENARRRAKLDLARRIERKLAITMAKKQKAVLELEKVEKRLRPAGPPLDRELITEEEMHMYLKLGLKMKAFLLLGRRGVFDGTIENMHLHWKHRELVKIIYKARNKIDLEQTAKMLEYESGGILIGTVPTSKGQAIIVYRGKNYSRPPELRPKSLLTKRQALKRSIELQRQEALERHMLALEKEIQFMQADLNKLGEEEEEQTEGTTSSGSDAAHSSDFDEDEEDIRFTGVKTEAVVEDPGVGYLSKRGKLDPLFRADPLSRREKLILRQKALKSRKAAHFNVGASNVVSGLGRAIRIHFQKHALVKVGVKGRAKGTPVEEIISQLENATGGTLVSQEASKIILYRGWPDGEERPKQDWHYEEDITPELRDAMITEEGMDKQFFEDESDNSDWEKAEEGDSDWDENEDDDDELMQARGKLDFEDDSDWDEDEDLEDDDDGGDDSEGVISRWQEDGSVSGLDGDHEVVHKVAAAERDGNDFEYEDDADDDVDFEWNEVEDGALSEDDDESHIKTEEPQPRN
ncbi:hypothetical protein R1flu_006750 [Riccia fluitans]|uniref:CRM domain-containing protein n=1 Tax=Riccia fluitans TaxID=41844 RepID=A0ABD1YXH9_9MARC